MKRIKILFTIPNFDTAGSGRVVYDLVKGLDKEKFAPEIGCFHNRGTFFDEVEKLGVKIHIFPFTAEYKPFITFPFRLLKLVSFFRKHKFDMIHSWHWSSDFSEPLGAKLAGIPFVYTKKAMGWGNKAWRWRSKLSSKIITINKDMETQFFSEMTSKIEPIPLGVDMEVFQPRPKKYMSPEGIELNKNDFVIVSVANLVPVKGIEILLKAVQSIDNQHIKTFVIGGADDDYGLELQRKFKNDKIFFLGKKMDVRPYLAEADIFVIPTKDEGRKEGMPIAPLEAMASGRIVVGSNISGIKDILAPFQQCLFEPGNVVELAEKLVQFKNMPLEEREELSELMSTFVRTNLSLKMCIQKHEMLYKSLIN